MLARFNIFYMDFLHHPQTPLRLVGPWDLPCRPSATEALAHGAALVCELVAMIIRLHTNEKSKEGSRSERITAEHKAQREKQRANITKDEKGTKLKVLGVMCNIGVPPQHDKLVPKKNEVKVEGGGREPATCGLPTPSPVERSPYSSLAEIPGSAPSR